MIIIKSELQHYGVMTELLLHMNYKPLITSNNLAYIVDISTHVASVQRSNHQSEGRH